MEVVTILPILLFKGLGRHGMDLNLNPTQPYPGAKKECDC